VFMMKYAILSLGALAVTACSGYQALDPQEKGPRIYLMKARTVPSLFENYTCPGNDSKIQICHVPPGNPAAKHTICIGLPAVEHHIGHHIAGNGEEDYLGDCSASAPPVVPDDTGGGTGGDDGGTTGGGDDGGSTGSTDGGTTDGGTTDGGTTDGGTTDGGTTDGGTTGPTGDDA
jgi:hypothetical protein